VNTKLCAADERDIADTGALGVAADQVGRVRLDAGRAAEIDERLDGVSLVNSYPIRVLKSRTNDGSISQAPP
jgi:hypothetical protein